MNCGKRSLGYCFEDTHACSKSPEKPPGDAATIDADRFGNVIFRQTEAVPVEQSVLEASFERCVETATKLMRKASATAAEFQVDEITIKLGLNGELGFGFLASAELEAAVELKIKRKDPESKPVPATGKFLESEQQTG